MKRRTFFKLASIAPFVASAAGTRCAACDTSLPAGARFCIECSAPQAATGATEQLNTTRYLRGDSTWQSLRYITVTIGGVPRKLLVSE